MSKPKKPILTIEHLNLWIRDQQILKDINLTFPRNKVTAMMGPSGCGKTTLIRTINRMHETVDGVKTEGRTLLYNKNLMAMNTIFVRRIIGMVFQRPNPFPTMSINENVLAGYSLNGIRLTKAQKEEIVFDSLTKAALWDEVKDVLHRKGTFLSGGQQQRLCIARALAMKPRILLLDEPTSALDPIATAKIEELIEGLRKTVSIILVTHNMAQASRISDQTVFMYLGEVIEYGATEQVFTKPANRLTEEYLSGKFG